MKKSVYRIKVQYNYYPGTFYAPEDGKLTFETTDKHGMITFNPYEFDTEAEAEKFLIEEKGLEKTEMPALKDTFYSASGTYYLNHGQYSRPKYRIYKALINA